MAPDLYDISPLIDARLAVWPGDTAATREVLADLAAGDDHTLSTLRSTVHLGAHADAPSHFEAEGATIDAMPLDAYLGSCQVIDVAARRGQTIRPDDLGVEIEAERILLVTGTYPDPTRLNTDFAAPGVELIDMLADAGVRLVGVDTPSVDLFHSEQLPVHHRLIEHGMASLEGLVLTEVPPGSYELIALPLRLGGFEASPVRAIIRSRACRPEAT
jgi:arylformamidase